MFDANLDTSSPPEQGRGGDFPRLFQLDLPRLAAGRCSQNSWIFPRSSVWSMLPVEPANGYELLHWPSRSLNSWGSMGATSCSIERTPAQATGSRLR